MTNLTTITPRTSARMATGLLRNSEKAIDMPTETKNRPSSKPLKGWRLLSSSCRYSLSASSTPPIKAPRAGERPRACVASAAPITSARARAVKASRTAVRAMKARSGRTI
ncbi:hypothetical protein D3C87_1851190 [compost metagenome]